MQLERKIISIESEKEKNKNPTLVSKRKKDGTVADGQ